MSGKPTDPVKRFWSKVDTDGPVVSDLGPCWRWLGKPHESGYGRISPAPGLTVYAHRYSYELLVHRIPVDLQIDHLCRNTMCVKPDHLEPVTQRVNQLRGEGPAAVNARKTHCPKGHPLAGEHLYSHTTRIGGPGRRCRTCNTQSAREYRARLAVTQVAA